MRKARRESKSEIYHVMMRGNNHQRIFIDTEDKKYFIFLLTKYLKKLNLELYAWCLMDNHFHLLIKASKVKLADFVKRVCCSYVPYFNRKYEHSGHLFQDRYKSEPVETDRYFMGAIRYIHNNPEKANICPTNKYKWSSYKEYLGIKGIVSTDKLFELIQGKENFLEFSKLQDSTEFLDNKVPIWDKQAEKIIKKICKSLNINNLKSCTKEMQKKLVFELINKGISFSQIIRITHLSRYKIYCHLRM